MTNDAMDWPGRQAAERAYGAFADAIGLKSLRQMAAAMEGLTLARADELAAQTAFAQLAGQAGFESLLALPSRVQALAERDGPLTSPMALLRLWLGELDAAMHRTMLSEAGLAATATSVRAVSRRRLQTQRVVSLGSEAIGAPTRDDLDDAFREVQQLKREVRALKAGLAARRGKR
jgi:hypothetical protein